VISAPLPPKFLGLCENRFPPLAPTSVTVILVTPLGTVKVCRAPVYSNTMNVSPFDVEGACVGKVVGECVYVGDLVKVGPLVGRFVGDFVGNVAPTVGPAVGLLVGAGEGFEGLVVGRAVGMIEGLVVGALEGL